MGLYDTANVKLEKSSEHIPMSQSKIAKSQFYEIQQNDFKNSINKRKKYGEGKEAAMIRDEMGDFDPMTSEALQFIKFHFGNSLRLAELKGIINAIRNHLSKKGIYMPKLSRNANRNYQLCIKYVQDHFELMKDIIPFVKLCDDQGNIIPIHEF